MYSELHSQGYLNRQTRLQSLTRGAVPVPPLPAPAWRPTRPPSLYVVDARLVQWVWTSATSLTFDVRTTAAAAMESLAAMARG